MIFLPLLSPEFATEFLKGRSISLLQMFIVLQSCRRLLPLHLDISAGSRTRVMARCPAILRSFARIRQPAETKQSVYSIALQPYSRLCPVRKGKIIYYAIQGGMPRCRFIIVPISSPWRSTLLRFSLRKNIILPAGFFSKAL